jgi:hypothetical protein
MIMMNLPNYFFADLPPEAVIGPQMLTEACLSLKRNREHYLAPRSTDSLVRFLSTLGENWLDDQYPFRRMALDLGPDGLGFSRPVLAKGLDLFFRHLTRDHLSALLEQDLGNVRRLDEMVSSPPEESIQRAAMAVGPEFIFHIAAGNLPSPALISMVLGLLTRSAQFIKCASGAALLPRLFAHSIYEADSKLGACIEVAEWPGGKEALETVLFEAADCVTATGSDETLAAIRQHLPAKTRFVGYGHRVSFGYISGAMLSGLSAKKTVARAAEDVVSWDQLGCLSPHVFYVEPGGAIGPEQFAEMLAAELERIESVAPRGSLPSPTAAAIASRRAFYEVRAAHSDATRCWFSKQSTAWTVLYEADPQFQLSCLNRFSYVKSVANLQEALQNADAVRGKVSTVGLAAPEDRQQEMATVLARWGVTRICPLGRMQAPPAAWRHDGRPALADLVTWADWEMAG